MNAQVCRAQLWSAGGAGAQGTWAGIAQRHTGKVHKTLKEAERIREKEREKTRAGEDTKGVDTRGGGYKGTKGKGISDFEYGSQQYAEQWPILPNQPQQPQTPYGPSMGGPTQPPMPNFAQPTPQNPTDYPPGFMNSFPVQSFTQQSQWPGVQQQSQGQQWDQSWEGQNAWGGGTTNEWGGYYTGCGSMSMAGGSGARSTATGKSNIIGGINMFSMRSGGRNTGKDGSAQAMLDMNEDCREGETVYVKNRSDDGWKPVVKGARVRRGHDDEAQVGALANAFSALAEEGRKDDEVGEPPVVGGWGFDSRKGRSPKQRISISPKFMSNM